MTPPENQQHALAALHDTVYEAAAHFRIVHPDLFDGYHTAHDVLAHLTFWMCEHVRVAQALVDGTVPDLREESIPALNRAACAASSGDSMGQLVDDLLARYEKLDALLRQLPDWSISFPIKASSQACTVDDRIFGLTAHLHYHVTTLRRSAFAYPELSLAQPA
ncbi:MAG: hypothetical protein JW910_15705 [Anaerolineae bacterium]|nr:hypothetical protein [Anaerolineae bacterium]